MLNKSLDLVKQYSNNKSLLTLWMNNLLVLYAFFLPISQSIKATIFVYIVALFVIRGDLLKYLKTSLQNKVIRAFLYLFLVYVIGVFWSDNLATGLDAIKNIKYGLYLMIFYTFIDARYINKVLTAFILGMLLSELTSYGMLFGIMPWQFSLGDIVFYTAHAIGDSSPFLHHIHYGVALAFSVILIGQKIYLSKESLWLRVLMSIFVLSATVNIFVTGGRTGYITFILLLFTLAVFYLKRYAFIALVFLTLVLGIAYTSSPIFKAKVEQTQRSVSSIFAQEVDFSSSLGQRAGMFYYGFELIKNNLILGVGTGDSINEIRKIASKKWTALHKMPHEHNQFLSTFIKLGLVGLSVFLNIYYQIFKYKQEDKELRFIMIFATLSIAFGILTTQFNLRFFMPLWVVMLTVTLISRERRTIDSELNNKKQLIQTIAFGAILSITSLVNQLL